ncbi:sulfatase [Halalkalibaculum sp. DA384]|uniref:sulfatase family protein n=1 Tax=Halalkalibaculum sp. DA384 TaxID=3373606 RepID=UPI003755035B
MDIKMIYNIKCKICFCLYFLLLSLNSSILGQTNREIKDTRPNILFMIVDDWSYPHASAYGDEVVETPTFDRIAEEGILFHHAFVTASSCTPSRSSILTGQPIHKLEEGGVLASFLPSKFPNYVNLLEESGYIAGLNKKEKGWSPGIPEKGGYTRNPAGPRYAISEFIEEIKNSDQPYVFWFGGSHGDVHRPYKPSSGQEAGLEMNKVNVPEFLPDVPEIRSDLLDYYYEVQRFDREAAALLEKLENIGKLENTLIVYTSDNGMPFPRAKANVYDFGTRMPLAISWTGKVEGGRKTSQFVSFADFAPTFLEVAGLDIPESMTGKSLVPLFKAESVDDQTTNPMANHPREQVFIEHERHAWVRAGNKGYPVRAIRTKDFLYVQNIKPDRWPAGDPHWVATQGPYGDIDSSPSKTYLMEHQNDSEITLFFKLAVGKRPHEELYDISEDPYQLNNVATKPEYQNELKTLQQKLKNWQYETSDPRFIHKDYRKFETYPYYIPPMRR